jgi:hypothetical protein
MSYKWCFAIFILLFLFMMNKASKIFVWNCRGASNTSFFRYCKQYITMHKPVMIVIVETRCDPLSLDRTFKLLGYDGLVATNVQGYAGGIAVAWQKDQVSVEDCIKKFQFIHLKVNYSSGEQWYFTAIYASPNEENRSLLWEDLREIARNMKDAWLLAGDFNDIASVEEKKGGAIPSMRRCSKFRERINACKLLDLGAMGPKYTWRGPLYHGGQRIYERLDRALCNEEWRLKFSDGYVKVLNRVDFSDHHPLIITPKDAPYIKAPRQFRFESAWLLDNTYNDMLNESWRGELSIIKNLENVQQGINRWKLQTFDQVVLKKKEIMARLTGIQKCIHNGNNSGGLRHMENKLQGELSNILEKEELMWFQRSRAKWLSDGDRNTRYYHTKTVSRRRRNNVLMLKNENGQWIEEVEQLQGMVNEFFQIFFSANHNRSEWFNTEISFPILEEDDISKLALPVQNDEIKSALFSMSPWKAPGPDGFPAGFYQKAWGTVGNSVCEFVCNVWNNPSSIAMVNQTDICLIPKVHQPEYVTQFRPISLCNTIYKIVSKVVVERLKICIPKLVSPFQTGFVPGRNIHENIIVAKEMVHSMHKMKGRKGAFAVKVDLSKAYDKLSWEFIWRILCELKLPINMVNVIMHAVTSVETNVKWNGARSEYFRPQRGIRQGDPISPYLFVLCMDKLSHLILHTVNQGVWRGIQAGRNGPMVSHLMFADDLLLLRFKCSVLLISSTLSVGYLDKKLAKRKQAFISQRMSGEK